MTYEIPPFICVQGSPSFKASIDLKNRRRHSWRCAIWILGYLSIALFSAQTVYASPIPQQFGHAGQLLFASDDSYSPALALDTTYSVDIAGPVANIVLRQGFTNNTAEWQEGIYIYPLSENASVHYLAMTLGDRKIIAQIKEKAIAQKIYSQAKAAGKTAALLEQKRDNIFQQSIANIAPGETVAVEIHLQVAVDYNHPIFSLTLPTTITPRYSPAAGLIETGVGTDSNNAVMTAETTDVAIPVTNRMEIAVSLAGQASIAEVTSTSHPITVIPESDTYSISTVETSVLMDRDFTLQWSLPPGSPPEAVFYSETVANEQFGLLMLTPPTAAAQRIAQDIIFIIDTSGSMGGQSLLQAKRALMFAIEQLQPGDRFNIIEFNSTFTELYRQTQPANELTVKQAANFIHSLEATGGTEMMPALMSALTSGHDDPSTLRQVVFITDGAVGNESELFKLIHQQLEDARLFTVGIGSAPNGLFMRKAAQLGRGSFVFINDISQVDQQIQTLITRLNSAVLRDVNIDWPSDVEAWPEKITDLYSGEPIFVAVKFGASDLPQGNIALQGFYSDGTLWQNTVDLTAAIDQHQVSAGIDKLWAKEKITSLLDLRYQGYSEEDVRQAVLPIALTHHLISPYTSFVAVEEKISRPEGVNLSSEKLQETRPLASFSLPAPQTANATLPLLLLGFLLGTCGLFWVRR